MEYYDCLKDPIKNYFLEKMQNTLVSKEALAVLIKTNNQEEKEVEKNSYNLRSFEGIYSTKNKANYDTKQNLKNFVERIENYKKMKVYFFIKGKSFNKSCNIEFLERYFTKI